MQTRERIDLALTKPPCSLSRRAAKRSLDGGLVLHEGKPLAVASRIVDANTHVTLVNPDAEIPILVIDRDLVFIDKPPAIPTQPSPGSSNPSALEVLGAQLRRAGQPHELLLVHRLDTNTTGVMVFARTRQAAEKYSRLISSGETRKVYLAVVRGRLDGPRTIDAPIARVEGNFFGISPSGKSARSDVTVLDTNDDASLVEVTISTGRTHQIRIHLAHEGHAVLGDRKYGADDSHVDLPPRPMLHAQRLDLEGRNPVIAPLPTDMTDWISRLGLTLPA